MIRCDQLENLQGGHEPGMWPLRYVLMTKAVDSLVCERMVLQEGENGF